MRELIYAVEGKAANLMAFAVDEPGHGGACHEYRIEMASDRLDLILCYLRFQNGPICAGNGVNGIQMEDLIAICIDRLEGFQRGPYAHGYNADALKSLKCALASLQQRTRDRIARGIEGTHTI